MTFRNFQHGIRLTFGPFVFASGLRAFTRASSYRLYFCVESILAFGALQILFSLRGCAHSHAPRRINFGLPGFGGYH